MAKRGLHVNIYRVPGGIWRCDIKLNTSNAGEGITVRGTSEDDEGMRGDGVWSKVKGGLSKAGTALAKARTIAKALLSNPAIAAAFPQYVAPALLAMEAMEKAEKRGALGTVKKQLVDPTLKKFAREMDEMSKGQRSAMSGGGICLACDSPPNRGMRGYSPQQQPRSNGRNASDGLSNGPFGLPDGNPHPWSQQTMQQLWRGVNADPLAVQKLVRMNAAQRRHARSSR